ncbi:MAG: hypothetical protein RBT69_03935 [Spirochaetia bacterium]|jgi:hypothetical protein|nr:hypothetical protein [Spirochaetia bacterium]
MDMFTTENLREIIAKRSGWCISLFMPTHRAGRETEQNSIRFKNLLRDAEERLLAKEQDPLKVEEMLKEPRSLLQNREFWQHQSDGLALFFSGDHFNLFRLPVEFTEMVVVSSRFHVKPLLPVLTSDGTFHILAISQNQLRLLEGTRRTVDEIELGDTPETLFESLPESWPKKKLQFHIGTPSGGGSRSAKSHGHDTGSDTKQRLRKWFRMIDKAVVDLLAETRSPLVLAGVESLFPLYKEVNTYPHLVDEGIPGNPDEMKSEELHPMAWAIVEPIFAKEREAGLERYRQLAGTGKTTVDVSEAILAAHHGQIDILFVALGVQVWGRFDPGNGKVHLHETRQPGDEDLLDFAAIRTIIKGGAVFAVSQDLVPDKALAAAVLRY